MIFTKKIILLVTLFAFTIGRAQNIQGRAFYECNTSLKGISFENEKANYNNQDLILVKEKIRKSLLKTFVLDFNQFESLFKQQQKLEISKLNSDFSNLDGSYYKNIKNKLFFKEEEFLDKNYIITDSLTGFDWKIEPETKKIGEYLCYKAICIIKISEDEIKEYENIKKKQDSKSTHFFEASQPSDRIITAWYTPTIPVSIGPNDYFGLPGLILEVTDGDMSYSCSKIIINPKNKILLKPLKKGILISQKNFETLLKNNLNN